MSTSVLRSRPTRGARPDRVMEAPKRTSLELFTGAGGLALGVARAGFEHLAVIEWNGNACASLRDNATRLPEMAGWAIHERDVREFDFRPYADRVTLLAAGAPCQPFSLGGKHGGDADHRNMFPEVFRAAREIRPQVIIVENVKGLLRQSFRSYFEYILLQLSAPEFKARQDESWMAHKERLERAIRSGRAGDLRYNVDYQLLNAADFGVPQRRERVFVVAYRRDLGLRWERLRPSHCEDTLLYAKWVDGSYWREHGLRVRRTPDRLARVVERLRAAGAPPELHRWRTVRDCLRGLPEPTSGEPHPSIWNHVCNPGARSYPGHTGSPWDEPAKTLKAGDHGVPGGENMLRHDDGSVRYFTVREAARLQGFPDEYRFHGAWSEGFRQLGNAVPVDLARVVAQAVGKALDGCPQGAPQSSEMQRVA